MYQTGCFLSLDINIKMVEYVDDKFDFESGTKLATYHWKGNVSGVETDKHIRECVIEAVKIPSKFMGKYVAISVNFNHTDETINGNWKQNWHLEGVSVMFQKI